MSHPTPPAENAQETAPRRSFLTETFAVAIGGLAGLVPGLAGFIFFLNPLLKKKAASNEAGAAADEFRKVASLNSVPGDGKPQMFKVLGSKTDAWTTYPETELGAVYLSMRDGKLECFNARCPHLGCTVNYQEAEQAYVCPCHDSSFGLNGERSNAIPPRNMDALDVEVRDDSEVWVKFQNFRAGKADQEPV
ncbi:MAG: Rieske 2Fe-2S domain-containing protein [Planctomycetaceae bacterium]|nr:Rieske 2Fe-2S domain-containing protein [Planctomycetaceae bacterium]